MEEKEIYQRVRNHCNIVKMIKVDKLFHFEHQGFYQITTDLISTRGNYIKVKISRCVFDTLKLKTGSRLHLYKNERSQWIISQDKTFELNNNTYDRSKLINT